MKAFATALLLAAVVVFLVARVFEDDYGWLAPIRAMAEAAMVGALADWFAVTALFRHPLGLPIPHTAIIPANKDRIGRSLGDFVRKSFLDPDLLAQRVGDANVARHAGSWLAEPANARRAGATVATFLAGVGDVLDDEEASAALQHAVVTRLHEMQAAPMLATALEVALREGHHHALVDSMLKGAGQYLDDHRTVLRKRLSTESPWWVPEPIDDRIFAKVFGGAKRFLSDLSADPQHELRRDVDQRLFAIVGRLRTDPDLAAQVEARKDELLAHPSVQAWTASLWGALKGELAVQSRDPSSTLRTRLDLALASAGARLRDDPALQATIDRWFADAVQSLAVQYGQGVADFITSTVERWDTAETTERLELQVGRDLQFIRINGTVVGGLVGLAIYAVSQFL